MTTQAVRAARVTTLLITLTSACDDSVEHIARPPAPPNDGVYSVAGGCYAIDATEPGSDNTRWLAASDVGDRFLLPQRFYGREPQLARLLEAFEGVGSGPSQLLLVSGYAGVGKTSLIRELYRPSVGRHGRFIAGKFDQVASVPYGALLQAFRDLIQQILTEDEEQVAAFLAAHPAFRVVPLREAAPALMNSAHADYLSLTPARNDTDGFFAAVMQREASPRPGGPAQDERLETA